MPNLKTDALNVISSPINAFFDAIIANPNPINALLQVNALQAALIAKAPALEGVGIGDTATLLKTRFNTFLASQSSGSGSSQYQSTVNEPNIAAVAANAPVQGPLAPSIAAVNAALTEVSNEAAISPKSDALAAAIVNATSLAQALSAATAAKADAGRQTIPSHFTAS